MRPEDKPDHTFALDDPDLPRIGLTNDVIFRHLFARRERKDWLLALVNALLELEGEQAFTNLEILDSVQSRDHLLDRDAVVDIIAVDGTGKQVYVEVQLLNHPGFVARILYYWAKLYSRQLGPKESFFRLKPTISLVITDFFVSEEEKRLHAHWGLNCRYTSEVRSDLLAIHFIQLPALGEGDPKGRLRRWVYALKHGREILQSQELPAVTREEKEQTMAIDEAETLESDSQRRLKKWVYALKYGREILQSDELPSILTDEKELVMAIEEAKSALVTDADLRQRALSREMKMRDEMSIMADNVEAALNRGRQEGIEIGEERGKQVGKMESLRLVVYQMLSMNLSHEMIRKATGLEPVEIEKIASQMQCGSQD